jgi:hypothetical protein
MSTARIVEWIAIEAVSPVEVRWRFLRKCLGLLSDSEPELKPLIPILHIIFLHLTHGRDYVTVGEIIHEM